MRPKLKMARITVAERGMAIAWLQEGVAVKEVARRLNRSPNAIRKLRHKYQTTGQIEDLPRAPRQRVTTVRQDMANLDQQRVRNLTNSMRRRCLVVIQNNGGQTKY